MSKMGDGRLLVLGLGLAGLGVVALRRGGSPLRTLVSPARKDLRSPESVHGEIKILNPETDVSFDAVPWLEQASAEALKALRGIGWGGDTAADDIAWWMASERINVDVTRIVNRAQDNGLGFEVYLDEEQAIPWLDANRPGWNT